MARNAFLRGLAAAVVFSGWLGAARPLLAGEAVEPAKPAVAPGRLRARKAPEAEKKKCEERLQKLAAFFDRYRQNILDATVGGMLGGMLPPNAKVVGSDWPDPLKSCREIQAAFASDPSVRGFALPRYSYEGLCRLNQLINAGLEKGGYHAYFSETSDQGRLKLTCVAGELLDLQRDEPLKAWGKAIKADPKILGKFLVRYPLDAYETVPSFTSDRKVVYVLTDVLRLNGRKAWNRLESLRKKGVDFEKNRIESEDALKSLKGLEGSIVKLTFAAWRDVYCECRRDRTEEEALAAFVEATVESHVDDLDLYEEILLGETGGNLQKYDARMRTRCALSQIVHARHPMGCVLLKATWLGCREGDPYRVSAEKFLALLLAEAAGLPGAPAGGGEADARPLAERLADLGAVSPEDLRRCAEAAFKKWSAEKK
jgi:hypothetical protein